MRGPPAGVVVVIQSNLIDLVQVQIIPCQVVPFAVYYLEVPHRRSFSRREMNPYAVTVRQGRTSEDIFFARCYQNDGDGNGSCD
jgi:hypothetical protein